LPYFAVWVSGERWGQHVIGIRDVDGRFTLGVNPGTWQLKLLGPGTGLHVKQKVCVKRGQVLDLGDIRVERGQCIAGHVRDANGTLVANARVRIGSGIDLHQHEPDSKRWFEGEFETTTSELGAYVFDGIAPRGWAHAWPRLIAATHPFVGASLVQLLPQEDCTLDFVLLGVGTIEGIVEGVAGRNRFVELLHASEPAHARWMGTRGEFRFDDVPAGDYELSLRNGNEPPIALANVTVTAGQCTKANLVPANVRSSGG
jgi:hypothetical protein